MDAANVRIGDWLQQIGSTLDNLSDLIDAEGEKATTEQKHTLSALKSRRQIEFKRFEGREDWISNLPDAPSADQPKSTLSTPSAATIMQTIDDSILHNAQLSRDVAFVSDEVFTHAREIEKEQQGAYRRFTRISTYLYSAGWLIGLMGQFLGVEPVEE